MPQATLKFKLPEEESEMKLALKAEDYQEALRRVADEVFRPAFKHGYENEKLQALLRENEACYTVIGMLHDIFVEILKDLDLEL